MATVGSITLGGPEVLEFTEVERPVPLPTEVLVRVRAVGVNPVEAVIRSGRFPLLGEPPFILGWDVCGVVEDIEPGVTRFRPGDVGDSGRRCRAGCRASRTLNASAGTVDRAPRVAEVSRHEQRDGYRGRSRRRPHDRH